MQQVRSRDGTLIAYERSGAGAALVLVHGTGADHTRWAPVIPLLEQNFAVYAVDRRGRGQSGDAADYSIEREYEDVAAVVDSISGPVNLLGHSYGALCSLEAARRVTNLSKLILYEPPIPTGVTSRPPEMGARLQALLDEGDRDGVLITFLREVVQMPEHEIALMQKEPAWAGRVAAASTIPREFRSVAYNLVPERFRDFKTPTLLLLGGESHPSARAATEALHAALPNSRVVVMPGQRHIAMSTAPQLFARLVTEFLKE